MFKVFRGKLVYGDTNKEYLLVVDLEDKRGWWLRINDELEDWQVYIKEGATCFWSYIELGTRLIEFSDYETVFSGTEEETHKYICMIDLLENN